MAEELERFSKALFYVRDNINSDMALPQLLILLQVWQEEGITMVTLAKRLKMPQGTISRNLRMLGQFMTQGQPRELKGYSLVGLKPDLYDRKRLACFLTDHGKEVCSDMIEILGSVEGVIKEMM